MITTDTKKVKIHIWINGELVSISEFELIPALINSFVRNAGKFLMRKLEEN